MQKTFLVTIIVSLAVLGLNLMRAKLADDEYSQIEMVGLTSENSVSYDNPTHWITDGIRIGDKEVLPSGKVVAEIVDIRRYQEGYSKVALLKARVLTTTNRTTKAIKFKGQNIGIGSKITIFPNNINFSGVVVNINGAINTKKKILQVKGILYSRRPWFADSIRVGDKQNDQANGETIAEVAEVKTRFTEVLMPNSRGDSLIRSDKRFVDIEVTLSLQVTEVAGVDYFANLQPVKVGNLIYVPMEKYNLYEFNVVSVSDINQ